MTAALFDLIVTACTNSTTLAVTGTQTCYADVQISFFGGGGGGGGGG